MTSLARLTKAVAALREQIEQLIANDDYVVEEVAEKVVTLNTLLNKPEENMQNQQEYSLFLTEQLQWLSDVISKLSNDKRVIADSLLHLQRRRKAQKLYGENK
jgi:uncharacterized protein YoxC